MNQLGFFEGIKARIEHTKIENEIMSEKEKTTSAKNAQVQQEKEELKKRLAEIEEKEEQEKIDKAYPELKKMIGKCFRCKNSYSLSGKKWWAYQKIISIEPADLYLNGQEEVLSHCKVIYFQTDINGYITVKTCKTFVHSLAEEISESEFNKEFDKVIKRIEGFRNIN